MGELRLDGERVGYDSFGSGERVVVLLHATLMARSMMRPLALRLAGSGRRAITLDLIGTPERGGYDSAQYASDRLAYRVLSALEELGVERFVIGGSSVGSAVALEVALRAPERVDGLVLEGPFLEHGTAAAAYGWSALLATFTLGAPLLAPVGFVTRRLPRFGNASTDLLLDVLGQPPAGAAAWLRGMFYNRMGPTPAERATIATKTLILGFPGDPFHPTSDARRLHGELAESTLHEGGTILDLRLRPEKLSALIEQFIADCERQEVAA